MQFFKDSNIDFLKYRWVAISVSLALIGLGIVSMATKGLNFGIDFVGGITITLRFKEAPDLDHVREVLKKIGQGGASIQRYDAEAKNQVMFRVQSSGKEEDTTSKFLAPLTAELNAGIDAAKLDLNLKGKETIAAALRGADPDRVAGSPDKELGPYYDSVADAIVADRSRAGILSGYEQLSDQRISAAARDFLKKESVLGNFVLLNAENVGPAVGAELRKQALLAVIFSTLGMLAYIWLRFDFKFGVGAIVAMIHDVVLTVGVLSLTGQEISLTVVAALLTLIGYSVNDTVVIFDRIRENRRASRREPFYEQMNRSLNQTLSRTILTSLLTMLVVIALFFFGGEVLRTFSFTMWFGIITGTYSTIYVAAALVYIWEDWQEKRRTVSGPAAVRGESGSPRPTPGRPSGGEAEPRRKLKSAKR